jgi:AhpD family alkylhydroperoxidase
VNRYVRRKYGREIAPSDVWAHHPLLFAGYGAFESATDYSRKLDTRLKDLAATKAAMLVGCEWCCDIASDLSRGAGISDEQLMALPAYEDSDAFSDDERLVLDYAVAMTRTPAEVSDELWRRLTARFDEPQLVELTAAIAIENLRARFNNAFDIEPQGFSEGAFCVIPERALARRSPVPPTPAAGPSRRSA